MSFPVASHPRSLRTHPKVDGARRGDDQIPCVLHNARDGQARAVQHRKRREHEFVRERLRAVGELAARHGSTNCGVCGAEARARDRKPHLWRAENELID